MTTLEQRRTLKTWTINQNPTTITISRTEKVKDGGGFKEVKSSMGPLTIRIYPQKSSNQTEVSALAGTKQINAGWGMSADYLADVRAGTNVSDEFTAQNCRFKIVAVNPELLNGAMVGYQCDLEKIN